MAYKRGDIVVNYPFGKRSEIIKQNITKNEKNVLTNVDCSDNIDFAVAEKQRKNGWKVRVFLTAVL